MIIIIWIFGIFLFAWSGWLVSAQSAGRKAAAKAVFGAVGVVLAASSVSYFAGMRRLEIDPDSSGAGMRYAMIMAIGSLVILSGVLLWETMRIWRRRKKGLSSPGSS